MKLRQVALVARDLEAVVADLTAVLGIEVAYRDPGVAVFGLHNAVLPIGDTFLEVVSPTRADASASRFLERRGGDGGYMAIFQCDDLDAERRRVADLGLRVVWSIDLPEARTIHLHPRDVGGAIVSLDSMTDPNAWHWAGPEWRSHVRTSVVARITGVTLQASDRQALARRWAALLQRPAVTSATGALEICLDAGRVRFENAADGRGDGISAVSVAVADRERLMRSARARGIPMAEERLSIGGVRFELEDTVRDA